jgi:DNA-binding transcriptional LysR family regulator
VLRDAALETQWRKKHLRLGYSVMISPFGEIDKAVTAFRALNPSVLIMGYQHHHNTLLQKIRNDELDVAIIPPDNAIITQDLEVYPFAEQDMCLCVPADITDDRIDPACWNLPLLCFASWEFQSFEFSRVCAKMLSDLGLEPTTTRLLPNVQSICMQLETGRCVAVVDRRFGLQNNVSNVRYIPLDGINCVCCCVKSRTSESPLADTFIRFLREYYGQRNDV